MGKGQYFKGISGCRYSVTATDNGSTQVNFFSSYSLGTASPTWELVEVNVTYAEFCNTLKKHFGIEQGGAKDGSLQSYRNHLSTLNSYLASVGKTMDSRIGIELGSGFGSALKHYLEIVQVSRRTKRDRRNHLQLIRRLHLDLAAKGSEKEQVATSLSLELRSAIARTGLEPQTLARSVGASTSALKRWLKGAMPNARGIPSLHRLESALGLARGHLVDLIEDAPSPSAPKSAVIPYRVRLKSLTQDKYFLAESDLTAEFREEWQGLFSYKTGISPMLRRHPKKGKWRCIPIETATRISVLARRGNTACPTANIALQKIRSFLGGIQSLSFDQTGLQQTSETPIPQTLAWLAYPDALDAYLDLVTRRSDDVVHNGQKTFCSFVGALVRPSTGYLWQCFHLASRLPESIRPATPDAWHQMCEQSHKLLSDWFELSSGVSRDPVMPLRGLLQLDNPLEPVVKAIAAIEKAADEAPPGSLSEALLRRDALLLCMLLANPLRLRTFMAMTWLPDDTGTLRGNPTQGWRIHLQNHHFKNGTGQKNRPYDVGVAKWVEPRLGAYIEEYRATILGGQESAYLFVSSRFNGIWGGMGAHVRKLTERYIEGCPGFGAHGFRHLVATVWLTNHPNDFLTVAELLNDELKTVIKHYAHLKRDISFQRYEGHLSSMTKKRP